MTLEEMIEKKEKLAEYHDKEKMAKDTWHYTNELLKIENYQLVAYLKELKEYRESWKRLEEEMSKLDPDNDSFSVKNNACMLVKQYKPKDNDKK